MSRVAIFGGTFDPPHRAHLALAHAALRALALAEVRWIPTGHPWQKARAVSPAAHRVAMVEAAIRGSEGEARFVLDRIEVDRAGASYTIDTVKALEAREPGRGWVLLIGQDQYAGLHTWQGWRELLARCTLAVARRPGVAASPPPEVLEVPHRVVPLEMMDISSTDIRARVAAGRDIADLVPAEVAGYIARHGLYRH
ncbi:MAG: nicotinate-nucleotide adenylyltransferase [Rubrivivax sp.]|nr:nicotinate-nucleotide adenylyltransferase [Rubrivivax sp.]